VGPKFENFSNAIVHLDRSPLALLSVGIVEAWSQWYTLGHSVDALIVSSSGFGVTAGEVGKQVHTFYGGGCVHADLSAA